MLQRFYTSVSDDSLQSESQRQDNTNLVKSKTDKTKQDSRNLDAIPSKISKRSECDMCKYNFRHGCSYR